MEKSYILISCDIGMEHELASQLQSFDEIKSVMITYGEYDIVIEAETKDSDQMDNLLTSKIRKLEKIRSSITLSVTV